MVRPALGAVTLQSGRFAAVVRTSMTWTALTAMPPAATSPGHAVDLRAMTAMPKWAHRSPGSVPGHAGYPIRAQCGELRGSRSTTPTPTPAPRR